MSSNDEDQSEDEVSLRDFTLIQFIKRGRQSVTRQVDIIPTKWLESKKQKGRFDTKFPEFSSNPEDNQLLHDLVKSLGDPPSIWKNYSVVILGQASTYEEALAKLKRLEKEDNVFTGSENDPQSETKKIEQAVKRQRLQNELSALNAQHIARVNAQKTTPKSTRNSFNDSGLSLENDSLSGTISTADIEEEVLKPTSRSTVGLDNFPKLSCPSGQQGTKSSNAVVPDDIPLINIHNVVCHSEFQTAVMASLTLILGSMQHMEIRIDQMNRFIECMDDRIQSLDNRIVQMDNHIQQMQACQVDTCNFLLDKEVHSNSTTSIDFKRKYKLELPLNDVNSFLEFDNLMKANDFLKRDVCMELSHLIDKDYCIPKSYLSMLRMFITKNVATKYTASRMATDKENPKEKFKPTEFYKCMEATMLTARQAKNFDTTEKDLTSSLSNVLSNSKKWKSSSN